jgi:hypothetical protein
VSTKVQSDLDFQGLAHLIRALLNPVTSDVGLTGVGETWFRTDLKVVKMYDGTAVHTIANLDAVVNSLTAGDGTVTVGGTSTAPTAKVAKTLDHTYVTDFDAQVRTSRLDQMASPTSTVSFNSQILTGIANAVNPTDALNLQSAQTLLAQISDRQEVYYATAGALPANTYANGASGVGATLTGSVNGALSVDSVPVAVGQRVLVQNEATAANDGIYTVTATGSAGAAYILTRAADFNQASNVSTGVMIPVKAPAGATAGTVNDNRVFISVAPSPVVVGTSGLTFALIGSAYTAGTGLTLTGTVFSLTIPVLVSSGGTGATTAPVARDTTHLGAQAVAPSGAGTGGVVSITPLGMSTKVLAVIGDGTTTTFSIAHNLGTTAVEVVVGPHGGGGNFYLVDSQALDANHVQVVFNVAPAASGVDVAIWG